MDRMLVVVFQNESNAFDGKNALLQLDRDRRISVYAYAIVAKNPNGRATVKQSEDFGPQGALAGNSLGSFLSLLGGPTNFAAVEFGAGASAHMNGARLGADFVEEVAEVFLPWRIAVIAEIAEGWTTPVDAAMEAIGGAVLRRALSQVKTVDVEDVTAIRADMAQLKAEQAKVRADRKAKLQEKMDSLDSRLRAQFQKARDRRRAAEREAQAKVHVRKAKTAPLEWPNRRIWRQ